MKYVIRVKDANNQYFTGVNVNDKKKSFSVNISPHKRDAQVFDSLAEAERMMKNIIGIIKVLCSVQEYDSAPDVTE